MKRRPFARDVEAEVEAELSFHWEELEDALVARGMDRAHAREEVLRRKGNTETLERKLAAMGERSERRADRREWLGTVWQDLRFGLRTLRRSPGFAAVAILTLALGIGANTAVFSVVNGILLRPMPYPDPDRVVHLGWIWEAGTQPTGALTSFKLQWWREHALSLAGVATHRTFTTALGERGDAGEAVGMRVSEDFFDVVGFGARIGRVFVPEEYRDGSPVAVLTDGFWRNALNADPGVIGRDILLDDRAHRVIGVLDPAFAFPPSPDVDLLTPLRLEVDRSDGGHNWATIARVRGDVDVDAARAEVASLTQPFLAENPDLAGEGRGESMTVQTYDDLYVGGLERTLLILLGAVGLVLLIACANVANLLLARGSGRRREVAVRVALGAGRGRLVRQLVTESMVLAGMAAVIGVVIGTWGVRALLAAAPPLPRSGEIGLDAMVLLFAIAAAVVTGLLFGTASALPGSRADIADTVKEGARTVGGLRAGRLLIAAEAALTVVLLAGAGLLIASFAGLRSMDLGMELESVSAVRFRRLPTGIEAPARRATLERTVVDRLSALPGVQSVAISGNLPLERGWNIPVTVEGRPDATEGAIEFRSVSSGYFETLRVPLVRGRSFEPRDGAGPPVVIINESTAARYWPDEDPIGKRLVIGMFRGENVMPMSDPPREVIGVVADHRDVSVDEPARRTVFVPWSQAPEALFAGLRLIVRSDRPIGPATISDAVRTVEPAMPAPTVAPLGMQVAESVAAERFNAQIMGIFAALALLLTAVGIYGVVAYGVRKRTAEIGVRVALGASRRDVLTMILRQGLSPVILGLVVGIAAAVALMRLIRNLLFDVSTTDPAVFVGVAAVLLSTAVAACWLPARRAARLDPVRALRTE